MSLSPANNSHEQAKRKALKVLELAGSGSFLSCRINGMIVSAPYEMLRLWPHCWQLDPNYQLSYLVETAQSNWITSRLSRGDCTLDIGAAFGLIALAMSREVTESGSVHAFEQARGIRKHLKRALAQNNAKNVVVVESAISDQAETAHFVEYTAENDLSWAPDASSLAEGRCPTMESFVEYEIPTTTIDQYVLSENIKPAVIKIHIEGLEVYALRGAVDTLSNLKPALCIGVHEDARTGRPSEPEVRRLLAKFGYKCRTEGHALYAEL